MCSLRFNSISNVVLGLCLFMFFSNQLTAQACSLPSPNNLAVGSLGTNGTTASWEAVVAANAYGVKVVNVVLDETVFSTITASTSTAISDLVFGGSYEITVQAIDNNGCISVNAAKAPFKFDYVIIDDIIKGFTSTPYPVICGEHYPFTANFSLKWGEGFFERFWIKQNLPKPLIYHENGECTSTCQSPPSNPGHAAGWHFGNAFVKPPLLKSSVNASIINAYLLQNSISSSSNFPVNSPTAQIQLTVDANQSWLSLCLNSLGSGVELYSSKPPIGMAGKPNKTKSSYYDQLVVQPNPFKETLTVNLGNPQPAKLQLFDLNGKLIFNQKIDVNNEVFNLQTNEMKQGIYLLRYETAEDVQTIKIVKSEID